MTFLYFLLRSFDFFLISLTFLLFAFMFFLISFAFLWLFMYSYWPPLLSYYFPLFACWFPLFSYYIPLLCYWFASFSCYSLLTAWYSHLFFPFVSFFTAWIISVLCWISKEKLSWKYISQRNKIQKNHLVTGLVGTPYWFGKRCIY